MRPARSSELLQALREPARRCASASETRPPRRHATRRRWTPPSASSRRRKQQKGRETAPKAEPREQRQAPEPRTDKPLMRKGRSQGWVVAPQIGDQHQAEIPDAPTRRARGPRRGRDAKASNVSDGKLAWQAGNWKPHPDGNKGGPCGDLILAARHALDEGHPEGWPPRRRGRRPRGHRAARALLVVGCRWAARALRK